MLKFSFINEDGESTVVYESATLNRKMSGHPLLHKALTERMTEDGVVITSHRDKLMRSMCDMLCTGAEFDNCSVVQEGGSEHIVFTTTYEQEQTREC